MSFPLHGFGKLPLPLRQLTRCQLASTALPRSVLLNQLRPFHVSLCCQSTEVRSKTQDVIPQWASKWPKPAQWLHPYASLARLDKPIGTWLLYWPCGALLAPFCLRIIADFRMYSLVYYHGSLFRIYTIVDDCMEPGAVRNRRSRHARRRVYDQRHVGPQH